MNALSAREYMMFTPAQAFTEVACGGKFFVLRLCCLVTFEMVHHAVTS
jgi:hypothetical protein